MCLLSDYEAHPVAVMEGSGPEPGAGRRHLGLTELSEASLATLIPLDASSSRSPRR